LPSPSSKMLIREAKIKRVEETKAVNIYLTRKASESIVEGL